MQEIKAYKTSDDEVFENEAVAREHQAELDGFDVFKGIFDNEDV